MLTISSGTLTPPNRPTSHLTIPNAEITPPQPLWFSFFAHAPVDLPYRCPQARASCFPGQDHTSHNTRLITTPFPSERRQLSLRPNQLPRPSVPTNVSPSLFIPIAPCSEITPQAPRPHFPSAPQPHVPQPILRPTHARRSSPHRPAPSRPLPTFLLQRISRLLTAPPTQRPLSNQQRRRKPTTTTQKPRTPLLHPSPCTLVPLARYTRRQTRPHCVQASKRGGCCFWERGAGGERGERGRSGGSGGGVFGVVAGFTVSLHSSLLNTAIL